MLSQPNARDGTGRLVVEDIDILRIGEDLISLPSRDLLEYSQRSKFPNQRNGILIAQASDSFYVRAHNA